MVHQHFMLADNLTVLENVVLGSEPRKGGWLDHAEARRRIEEISDSYGLDVEPDTLVEELGVGDRQRVEILKVLYRGAKILILDEPTAVLVPQEVDELFDNLRELKAEGLTVIFISHKLDEVLTVADEITVIRRGTTVATVNPAETNARALAELMVGSELPSPETRESTVTDEPMLTVDGADAARRPTGARCSRTSTSPSTRARSSASPGSRATARAELVETIMGMRHGGVRHGHASATEDVSRWHTRRRREAGIGYIPEDRHRHGLLLEAPLWENRILGHQTQSPNVKGPWIDRKGARKRHRAHRRRSTTCARPASTSSRPRSPAATSRSSSSAGR